jgi:hypothetical protein
MEWLVKNVKMLVILLVASLAANAGTTLWLFKTQKELAGIERAYGNQPRKASVGIQGQDVLSLLNQMNQRLTRLEDIAERKEQAEETGRAEQRKFFQSHQLPTGGEKRWGLTDK